MSDQVVIRTRKFINNRLLARKQMIIDVYHPGLASVSKDSLKTQLAAKFGVNDENTVFLFGFKTQFGGGKSTGFALVYDSLEDALDSEPNYRLVRSGLREASTKFGRKARKELKNRKKKVRGTKKSKVGGGK
jgi:small subunit ribosomal protein S24e